MIDTRELQGIAASPGVAVGPAFLPHTDTSLIHEAIRHGTPEEERQRWQAARSAVVQALAALAEHARRDIGPAEAEIFEAQHQMAEDVELEDLVNRSVDAGSSAEESTRLASAEFVDQLTALDDPYLRLRADDVREVARALVVALAGGVPFAILAPPPGAIVCAQALAAGELVRLDRSKLGGIALGSGGVTSHVAILARTLGVPAVVGLGASLDTVADGDLIGLDGDAGRVQVNPTGVELAALQRAAEAHQREKAALQSLVAQPAVTPDGVQLDLWANIGGLGDVAPALAAGATGVGLLRTEFLIAGRQSLPSEDEQYGIYREIAQALGQRPLVIRTFDIGGDKPVPALGLPPEANPFLGYRAIRIGLGQRDLLATQMRAIARVAQDGYPVWIMLPMVATLDEVRQAREVFRSVQYRDAPRVPLGIMVEIPSAALNASALASEVDFFSIGTNDLTQYTLAADRTDERLASLYQPLHPAVLRLIQMTASAATTAGIPCGVCGELAGDPRATAVLMGLGVTELSMSAGVLGAVKREMRQTPMDAARELAQSALLQSTTQDVLELIETFRKRLVSA